MSFKVLWVSASMTAGEQAGIAGMAEAAQMILK